MKLDHIKVREYADFLLLLVQLNQFQNIVADFSVGHKPSNKVVFQSSFDCNLPYNTMKTTSLDADAMTKADEQQALRSPIILSFAQGKM